ncbi:MAG: hypothetical protein HY000_13900 [Planctomycetes bacterium]|nr:hypothetical protein [Planctomycetota bacterium]
MDITEKFRSLAEEWNAHCQNVMFSSNMQDYLRHASYRKLIELGRAAVPLIMEQYQSDEFLPWGFVLQEITGVRMIDDPDFFGPSDVRRRWIEWWEQEQAKFLSGD